MSYWVVCLFVHTMASDPFIIFTYQALDALHHAVSVLKGGKHRYQSSDTRTYFAALLTRSHPSAAACASGVNLAHGTAPDLADSRKSVKALAR